MSFTLGFEGSETRREIETMAGSVLVTMWDFDRRPTCPMDNPNKINERTVEIPRNKVVALSTITWKIGVLFPLVESFLAKNGHLCDIYKVEE